MLIPRGAMAVVVGISGMLVNLAAAAEEPASGNTAILQLLDAGWRPAFAARAAADEQFEAARTLAPGDTRVLAAYWLVLTQQRRYEDALSCLNDYLKKQPTSITALHAKTWIETVLHEHDQALLSAQRLATAVAAQPAADGSPQDEAAQFLGRLFGYLAGPLADAVEEAQLQQAEAAVLAGFDSRRQELFGQGRKAVGDRFKELSSEASEAADEAKGSAAADREQALAKLDEQRKDLDEHRKKVGDRRAQIKKDHEANLEKLNARDVDLMKDERNQRNRITQLENDIQRFQADARRYNNNEPPARSANEAQRNKVASRPQDPRFTQAKNNAANAKRDLNRVMAQLTQTQNDRNNVQLLRLESQKVADNQNKELDREDKAIAAGKRRLDGIGKRKSNSKAGTQSGQTVAIDSKLRALSTYSQLPLEAYREKLAASLRLRQ